jgi:hypothetical protein
MQRSTPFKLGFLGVVFCLTLVFGMAISTGTASAHTASAHTASSNCDFGCGFGNDFGYGGYECGFDFHDCFTSCDSDGNCYAIPHNLFGFRDRFGFGFGFRNLGFFPCHRRFHHSVCF